MNETKSEWSREEFLNRTVVFKPPSKPIAPDLSLGEELLHFLSINLLCVVCIMMVMTFCYLSHVGYHGFKKRKDKAEASKFQIEDQQNDKNKSNASMEKRFNKDKEILSSTKSDQLEQIENMI